MKDNGLFWDGNKGACESCDKHCIEENLTHCAFQCKGIKYKFQTWYIIHTDIVHFTLFYTAYLQAKKESKDTELSYSRLEVSN